MTSASATSQPGCGTESPPRAQGTGRRATGPGRRSQRWASPGPSSGPTARAPRLDSRNPAASAPQRAATGGPGREREVARPVHVPGIGPEETGALECRYVRLEVCLRQHVGVQRQVGACPAPPNQPPSRRTRAVRDGLPRPLGFPFLNRAFTVLRTLASKAAVKHLLGHGERHGRDSAIDMTFQPRGSTRAK